MTIDFSFYFPFIFIQNLILANEGFLGEFRFVFDGRSVEYIT
jgi:hypothetical protein